MSSLDSSCLCGPQRIPGPHPLCRAARPCRAFTVSPTADSIDKFVDALGANVVGKPFMMNDGRVGHAGVGAGRRHVFYLADEYPEIGVKAPEPQAVSVSLMIEVADTDAALARADGKGRDGESGRPGGPWLASRTTIINPFGHRWMLSGPVTGASMPIEHGDVGYVSLWTPDADRAAAFYGHVLGWTYDRWFCAYFSRSVSCSPPTCAVWVVAATGIHTRAGGHRRRRESGEAERE